MDLLYRVHSATVVKQAATVTIDGVSENVIRDTLEVELTNETLGRNHGSTTLRFLGSELAEAMGLFEVDKLLKLTFESEPETPEEYVARRSPLMDPNKIERVPENQWNHPAVPVAA